MKWHLAFVVFVLSICLAVAQSAFPQVAEANSERDYALLKMDQIVDALRFLEPTPQQQEQWTAELRRGQPVCPSITEITVARNLFARQVQKASVRTELARKIVAGIYRVESVPLIKILTEGLSVSEAYIIKRELHAKDSLGRCRFQASWAAETMAKSPGGRVFLTKLAELIRTGYVMANSVSDYFAVYGDTPEGRRDLENLIVSTGWSLLDAMNVITAAMLAGAFAVAGALMAVLVELKLVDTTLGKLFIAAATYTLVTITVLVELQKRLLEAAVERVTGTDVGGR